MPCCQKQETTSAYYSFSFGVAVSTVATADLPEGHSPDQFELLKPNRETHRAQKNTGFVFLMSHDGQVVAEDFAGLAVIEHSVPVVRKAVFDIPA